MAHARHKAPGWTARLAGRPGHRVVTLAGAVLLVSAAVGPGSGSGGRMSSDVTLATTTVSGDAWVAELADLRVQRQATLERTTRTDERLALAIDRARVARSATTAAAPAPVAPLPATTTAYTTIAVNVRAAASQESPSLAVLEPGSEIAVTGRSADGYAEVVHAGTLAWVYAAYVADTPPSADEPATGGGVSAAPCASGSAVESGLTSNAIAVHRAVCALFPAVTSYGGVRQGDGGAHGSGHALDIMISSDVGSDIAAYLQANAAELGVSELIWRQRIWTSQRAGDGWRGMEDRGSATANHYDHVHVTVY